MYHGGNKIIQHLSNAFGSKIKILTVLDMTYNAISKSHILSHTVSLQLFMPKFSCISFLMFLASTICTYPCLCLQGCFLSFLWSPKKLAQMSHSQEGPLSLLYHQCARLPLHLKLPLYYFFIISQVTCILHAKLLVILRYLYAGVYLFPRLWAPKGKKSNECRV